MKYHLFKCDDDGNITDGVVGNASTSFSEDNEIINDDSLPVQNYGIMVMNTISGELIEIAKVKNVIDRWVGPAGFENVIFTDGKEVYHWWLTE